MMCRLGGNLSSKRPSSWMRYVSTARLPRQGPGETLKEYVADTRPGRSFRQKLVRSILVCVPSRSLSTTPSLLPKPSERNLQAPCRKCHVSSRQVCPPRPVLLWTTATTCGLHVAPAVRLETPPFVNLKKRLAYPRARRIGLHGKFKSRGSLRIAPAGRQGRAGGFRLVSQKREACLLRGDAQHGGKGALYMSSPNIFRASGSKLREVWGKKRLAWQFLRVFMSLFYTLTGLFGSCSGCLRCHHSSLVARASAFGDLVCSLW